MSKRILYVFLVFAFAKAITACNTKEKEESIITETDLEVDFYPFHSDFEKANPEDLPALKAKYKQFFPENVPDSIWIAKMTGKDTIQALLDRAVIKRDFNYKKIKQDLLNVMKHVKYYFPEFKPTPIYTYISEVDYKNKTLASKSELLVAIDTYLGSNHELYQGISDYQKVNLNIENLPADAALTYAKLFVEPTMDRSFIGTMVYYGKLHYLQESFAPSASGDILLGYSADKYKFAQENEVEIWRYFVDQELIFSTDQQLLTRFITPAPFSKFYLEIDQETPGGIGRYIGYRIVQSFMENNDKTTLQDLITLDAETIFNKSGYKPKL